MDNKSLSILIQKIPTLKHKYLGSFPSDQIPPLRRNTFIIVNTDPSYTEGAHWIMLANENGKIYFGDALGQPLNKYRHIQLPTKNVTRMVYSQIQNLPLCGMYCIYFAWCVFRGLPVENFFNDFDLMQFIHKYI